jgi:hypothetical protein
MKRWRSQNLSNSADTVDFIYFCILGYRPPFEANPFGEVQKFHGCCSFQNSEILIAQSESYARNVTAT